MDEILKIILQNTLVKKNTINTHIKHPINGKKLPKRTFYILLEKYANDFLKSGNEPRMVGLAGLPGTGKTTLMWQIAEYVHEKHKVPIYFFNVNIISTNDYTLYQILQAFQTEILKKKFTELTSPIVLLFDEVHNDPNWAKTLKILYDEARTAFIVCTGSSALLRQQTADLARRMKIEKVFPFRFIEFVTAKSFYEGNKEIYPVKDLSADLKNALFFSSTVDEAYHQLEQVKDKVESYFDSINQTFNIKQDVIKNLTAEYIKYNNIPGYSLYKEKTTILEGVLSLFESVIYQDIPKLKKGSDYTAEKIKRLLFQLAISDVINPDTLSQKTGIKKDDLENVLDIMDKAELLNILSTYGGAETRIWNNKKAFFMSPSLRLALLAKIYSINIPENLTSKLYEDIVVMYLRKTLNNNLFIASQSSTKSPDFVIETMDKPVLVEVGKGKTKTSQFSSIDNRYGILISGNPTEISKNNTYITLPLHWFLLL